MSLYRIYFLRYMLLMLLYCGIANSVTLLQAQHTINDVVKGVTSKSSKKPTTKTPKKTGLIANKYQDLTTRYNRYFNANLRYTEGIQSLEKSHKDDYEDILPIYAYKGGDGASITSNLDEAIKKTSIAIQKKPNSKWVDDCYLLIGKSYYLKGEYNSATEAFQYIVKNYSNNIRKSYDRQSQEKMRKLKEDERKATQKEKTEAREELLRKQQEEREARAKERADLQKEKAKEREEKTKQREKATKEKAKEREKTAKEKIKTSKEKAKEREKANKEKAKQREKDRKQREKDRKNGIKTPPKTTTDKEETKTEIPSAKKDPRAEKEAAAAEKAKQEKAAADEAEKVKKEKESEEAAIKEAAEKEATNAESAALGSVVESRQGAEKEYKGDGFLNHKLAKYEAMLWLARNYMDNKQTTEAEAVLDAINKDKRFPKRLKGQLMTLQAHQYMTQNKYADAKQTLQKSVKLVPKRQGKARIHYILAQLEAQDGNYPAAVKHYQKVLKSRPSFEMEFHAELNAVKSKLQGGMFTPTRALAALEKMANDGKNADYADQIYFEMSDIAAANGDQALAAQYLEKSASKGGKDPKQKALAYLRLAHLNYDKEKYAPAAAYYDSSLTALPKSNKDYETAKTRAEVLGGLVKNLRTIELQDSLQRIAKMPTNERNRYIDELIAQLQYEARKRAEEQQFLQDQAAQNSSSNSGAQFYFYNEAAKGMGYNDFINKWGNRPLVDNWRLTSKISGVANASGNDTTANNRENLIARAESLTREDILQQLPLTPQAIAASDSLIIAALYNSGNTYHNSLHNDPKAIEALEALLQRYPNSEYDLPARYILYSMYAEAGNTAKANLHKEYILNNHPNSVYAKMLLDPTYAAKAALQGSELEQYYEATYALHLKGEYVAVLQRAAAADSLFTPNALKPKFDLLRAFALGKTKDKNAYVSALQTIVLQYPTDAIKAKAQEILSYLESAEIQAANAANTNASASKYKYEPNARHYVIIVPDGTSQQMPALTKAISDFNQTNFSTDQLKTNQMLLDPEHQIVLVKEFTNSSKALFYYNAISPQAGNIGNGVGMKIMVMSKPNFSQFFKDKDVAAYEQFFGENYQ